MPDPAIPDRKDPAVNQLPGKNDDPMQDERERSDRTPPPDDKRRERDGNDRKPPQQVS